MKLNNYSILLLVLLFVGCHDYKGAEKAAGEYAKKLPGSTGEVSCMRVDSDGDGYVSCSAFMRDGPPVALECLVVWWRESGCKAALPKFGGRR